jgi:alanyl-tRNA synthetase
MRHAHMMGARAPLMHQLTPVLVRQMGAAYPELVRSEPLVRETLLLEETRFKAMLERGLGLLGEETARLGRGGVLPGAVAFRLYDTYGFPLDLTQDALREQGFGVDVAGFEAAMAEQRARARAAWAGSGEAVTERLWFELREKLGASEFLGYATESAEASIGALVVAGESVASAGPGTEVAVVLNQTPFYGESGGQVGDTGSIRAAGLRLSVRDTQKKVGDLVVHFCRVEEGEARVGQAVLAEVDHARRAAVRAHHSATHLLHAALRQRLGAHVAQKGSLNGPDRLRFDVSHPAPIGRDDLAWVEAEVNARIRENTRVVTRLMTPEAAVAEGAMALFGEKYGDEVRVVSMGGGGSAQPWSVELCGGTHVRRTGDIGLFHILGESAVSAGVRRLEAVAGAAALAVVAENERRLGEVAALLHTGSHEVLERVAALQEERRKLERQVAELKRRLAAGGDGAAAFEQLGAVRLAARNLGETPPRDLKGIAEAIAQQMGDGVVALVSVCEGKASVVVRVAPALTGRFNAVDLVRAAAAAVGGKGGGGRPDMAQAGGPDGSRAEQALAAVRAALAAA